MCSHDHQQKWSWWTKIVTKDLGGRKKRVLLVILVLCLRHGATWEWGLEPLTPGYGIPGAFSVPPLTYQGGWTHTLIYLRFQLSWTLRKPLSDVWRKQTKTNVRASANWHFEIPLKTGFPLQDPLPLQYSKSRFPQLISFNRRESPQTKAQPACLQKLFNRPLYMGMHF